MKVNAENILALALKNAGLTRKEVAERIGFTPAQLNDRIARCTLRADSFFDLMDAIDVDVTFTDRKTGKEIRPLIPGAGRRVRAMVDRVIYDTENADAIANNFQSGSEDVLMELYIDHDGHYFFACYSRMESVKDRISPVSADDAVKFIEKYGTLAEGRSGESIG